MAVLREASGHTPRRGGRSAKRYYTVDFGSDGTVVNTIFRAGIAVVIGLDKENARGRAEGHRTGAQGHHPLKA